MGNYNLAVGGIERPSVVYFCNKVINEIPELFVDSVKIKTVFGTFPGLRWAGGRVPEQTKEYDKEYIKYLVRLFNSLGIGVRLTLTNTLLKKEHMGDPYANMILEILAETGDYKQNGVTLVSSVLEEYLIEHYPELYIDLSVINFITEEKELKEKIDTGKYNLIVPYQLMNFRQSFLDLPQQYKDHVEIMTFACVCEQSRLKSCKFHYDLVSGDNLDLNNQHKEHNGCFCEQLDTVVQDFNFDKRERKPMIDICDINDVYRRYGFENYKLATRDMENDQIVNEVLKYSLKSYTEEDKNFFLQEYEKFKGRLSNFGTGYSKISATRCK